MVQRKCGVPSMTNDAAALGRISARSINTLEAVPANAGRRFGLSFPVAMTCLYAVLLGIAAFCHAIGYEEGQAWLIARDSSSIPNLFHNIRYEGHPSLWYLLLYLPAHISWNPASMQAINYVLAIVEAALIFTESRLSRSMRSLLVFSYFVFFGYGALARSYMLTTLLLTAAARCLLGERKRSWLAIPLLALACNAHFFAIPIAGMLFVSLYCFAEPGSWKKPARLLREMTFWASSAVLAASVAAAYFTIRPPADSFTPHYGTEKIAFVNRFLISFGSLWQAFVPVRTSYIPARFQGLLTPDSRPSWLAIAVSLTIIILLISAIRSDLARFFFVGCVMIETLAFAFTVLRPRMHHLGFIYLALLIALLVDAHARLQGSAKLPLLVWTGRKALYLFLTLVMLAGAWSFAASLRRPFSEGRETADWLKQSGYSGYPLVAERDSVSTSLLAHLHNDKAYHPECGCFESFILYNTGRKEGRIVTPEELDRISSAAREPVVVALTFRPDPGTVDNLGLHLLKAFDRNPLDAGQRFFVYLRQPRSQLKPAGQ